MAGGGLKKAGGDRTWLVRVKKGWWICRFKQPLMISELKAIAIALVM
jgi:hypothetical protein